MAVPRSRSPAPDGPPPALRLTERDRRLLRFAADHRFVLAAQLAGVLGISTAAAGRRLSALRRAGLLGAQRPLRHAPTAWAVTRRGLAVAGSELGVPRPLDLALYRHDVGVGWLAAAAERGHFGELSAIVSERRMRSEDARRSADATAAGAPGPPHGIPVAGGGGRRRHYPDLLLQTASGHRIAFELELSSKPPAHRERILAAYLGERRIDAVVYLAPTRAGAEAIRRSAARVGAAELVRVQQFSWAGGRAPGTPARGTARTARGTGRPAAKGAAR